MKTGIVASTFDLLHAGHVIMLKQAREQCDYLLAALQTDPTIDRPNKNQPVQTVFERFVQLEGCRYVDEIVVYATEKELVDIMLSYPINIRVLGEEYRFQGFTGKEECEARGIDFYFNRRDHSFSSTSLRQRVCDAEAARIQRVNQAARPLPINDPQDQTGDQINVSER